MDEPRFIGFWEDTKTRSVDEKGYHEGVIRAPSKQNKNMKIKNPRDYLNEAIALLDPEEQQAARNAVKTGILTPALAAALSVKIEEAVREQRANPADAGLATKVELLTNALRSVEQRLKDNAASREPTSSSKPDETLAKHVQGLREDMRGVQDDLASLRPYHRTKIIWLAVAVFALGCIAGWYGRIEYRAWEYERTHGGR